MEVSFGLGAAWHLPLLWSGEGLVCPPQGSGVPPPGGEGLVCPPQDTCAFPRGESGGKGLVCPLQEGRVWCALPSKCYYPAPRMHSEGVK